MSSVLTRPEPTSAPRRSRTRRWTVGATVVVLGLVGAAATVYALRDRPANATITGYAVLTDERLQVAYLTGSGDVLRDVAVTETTDSVRISILLKSPSGPRTSVGIPATTDVPLSGPLGQRTVIGRNGAAIQVSGPDVFTIACPSTQQAVDAASASGRLPFPNLRAGTGQNVRGTGLVVKARVCVPFGEGVETVDLRRGDSPDVDARLDALGVPLTTYDLSQINNGSNGVRFLINGPQGPGVSLAMLGYGEGASSVYVTGALPSSTLAAPTESVVGAVSNEYVVCPIPVSATTGPAPVTCLPRAAR